jgi:ABC-type Na+ transport system ATPase subunit NatA
MDFAELYSLPSAEIKRRASEIEHLLLSKSPSTRWAAVGALSRGGVGTEAIAKRLNRESNDLVLAELCDAVVSLECRGVGNRLRQLAREHSSSLARMSATQSRCHPIEVPIEVPTDWSQDGLGEVPQRPVESC